MMLILNLVIFSLNSVPKTPFFYSKFAIETSKYFVSNETQKIGVFKGAGSEFDNCFLKFIPPKYLFLEKFSPKKANYFVLNDARYIVVFRVANSEFANFFS